MKSNLTDKTIRYAIWQLKKGRGTRFHKILEDEIWNCPGLDDHIEYYGADRLHFVDMDNHKTPMMTFHNKRADD